MLKKLGALLLVLTLTFGLCPILTSAANYVPGMSIGVYKAAVWDYVNADPFGMRFPNMAIVYREESDGRIVQTIVDRNGNIVPVDSSGAAVWFDWFGDNRTDNLIHAGATRNGKEMQCLIQINTGKLATRFYDWIEDFEDFHSDGKAFAIVGLSFDLFQYQGLIDVTGREVLSPETRYERIETIQGVNSENQYRLGLGRYPDEKFGIFNGNTEDVVLEPLYHWPQDFNLDGMTYISKWVPQNDDQSGTQYIYSADVGLISDTNGIGYNWIGEFKDAGNGQKLAAVEDSNGRQGYINLQGQKVIPPQFDWMADFSPAGYAMVNNGEGSYYITTSGTRADHLMPAAVHGDPAAPEYWETAYGFSDDGFAWVRSEYDQLWYLINTDGEVIHQFVGDVHMAGSIGNDWAPIHRHGTNSEDGLGVFDYIRHNGDGTLTYLSELGNGFERFGQFDDDGIEPFVEDHNLAKVTVEGRAGLINSDGEWVLDPFYDQVDRGRDHNSNPLRDKLWTFGNHPEGTAGYGTYWYFDANTHEILGDEILGYSAFGDFNQEGYTGLHRIHGNSERFGILSRYGGEILPPIYDQVHSWSNYGFIFAGMFSSEFDEYGDPIVESNMYDMNGDLIFSETFRSSWAINDHTVQLEINGELIYAHKIGGQWEYLFAPGEVDWVDHYGEYNSNFDGDTGDILKVGRGDTHAFYKDNGNYLEEIGQYAWADSFRDGLARTADIGAQGSGAIDEDGNIIVPTDGTHWIPNGNNIFGDYIVAMDMTTGEGKWVIYDYAGDFVADLPDGSVIYGAYSEGLVPFAVEEEEDGNIIQRWGYADIEGNVVLEPKYEGSWHSAESMLHPFTDDLAWFKQDGKYGLLRKVPASHIAPPAAYAPAPGTYNNQVNINIPAVSSGVEAFYTIGDNATPPYRSLTASRRRTPARYGSPAITQFC